ACPSHGIDERDAEIIASEEPIEDSLGLYMPAYVFRLSEGCEAGSDCRVGFNRLLIKARTLFATPVKAVATDGYEVSLLAKLEFHEPRQRSDTCLSIGGIVHVSASEQQCTGQCSIIVGQNVLEPRPVLRTAGAECLHQLVSKIVARALHIAITGEAFEVFVDAEQCKRPGTRSGKLGDGEKRAIEEQACQAHMSFVGRAPNHHAKRPQSAPVAILRTDILQPAAVEGQQVAKAASVFVERVRNERQIASCQRGDLVG